jgi:transposase
MSRRPQPTVEDDETLGVVYPDAAGLDIGATEIWACVPAGRASERMRMFGTYTPDLQALAEWLSVCGVKTVALESTGVYWIPAFELLETRGFEVHLVNARQCKRVPGRKSDVSDCQWIQRLHSLGLLSRSFRPPETMCALRAYLRHRAGLLEHRAPHIQHMQKALQQMNVQLTQVLSDISGVTGLAIIRAIVAGERDAAKLATHRDRRCAKPESELIKALTGHYRAEHVFALKQALALYDAYTQQLLECDAEIEQRFNELPPVHDDDNLPPLDPSDKRNSHSKNGPHYDVRRQLYRLLGVDVVAITGLNASTVQTILTETGTDMNAWPNVKHFCSWLTLAPHNDISGGKVLRSRTLKSGNRAAQAFRLAAQSLSRSQTELGAFFRHVRAKHGPQKAIVATAHKLARIFYSMLKHRKPFHDIGVEEFDKRQRQREIARLHKKAERLGFKLVEASPQPA